MENNFSQQQDQKALLLQSQKLSAVQKQGLDLLAAPLADLETMLADFLESNPLLETISPRREELVGDPVGDAAAQGNELSADEMELEREDLPIELPEEISWSSDADEYAGYEAAAEAQKRHDYMLESLTVQETLSSMLFEQLDFCSLSERQRDAAEAVIAAINDQGFLMVHPADIAMAGNFDMSEIEQALELVRSFDPPGVGAGSASESLILQLKRRNYPDERIYRLLTEFSAELAANKLPLIAKKMNVDVEQIYKYIDDLKNLNSVPAAGIGSAQRTLTVIPEMTIELKEDQLSVALKERALPGLGLVDVYLKMLDDPAVSDETKQYLREKRAEAETLIQLVDKRQDTISRITEVIARTQAEYFLYGIDSLVPMTRAEVAAELDLDASTVSRAVKDKYLDTPQGIKPYSFFFSGGVATADGEDISSRSVKERIRDLIAQEDPRKPLSDAAVAAMLEQEGFAIARRTVAKYRESMDILPTNLRRRH